MWVGVVVVFVAGDVGGCREGKEEVTATVAFISGAEAFLGLVYGIWPEGGRAIHGPGRHMTKPQSNSHNPSFY